MTNETTPNERNRLLLKKRFANETNTGIENATVIGIENLKGFEVKVDDENALEYVCTFENVNGFENENRNENEIQFENENETRNETRNENELEMNNRNENELIKTMKNEQLFYSTNPRFQNKPQKPPKEGCIRIRFMNENNIMELYQQYEDTIDYYLEKGYLAPSEKDDLTLAVKRIKSIAKVHNKILDDKIDKMFNEPNDDTGLIGRIKNLLHIH